MRLFICSMLAEIVFLLFVIVARLCTIINQMEKKK